MNVLIIEDEPLAAERITSLLKKCNIEIEVAGILDSVEEAVKWFAENTQPDLMIVDIHLSDGLSFDIFKKINVKSPVVFTTAYDQYAIQAFKVNSIDYLLKPVSLAELSAALEKLKLFKGNDAPLQHVDFVTLSESIKKLTQPYKSRFLVKYGDTIQFKTVEEIAYFYADDKIVYLISVENRRFIVDYTLEELETMLHPDLFYRINRKFIAKIDAIKTIKTALNSRLQIYLSPSVETNIYISREKVAEFKAWIDR
jgi:DNA-binding LytR/AlgR family response regulator